MPLSMGRAPIVAPGRRPVRRGSAMPMSPLPRGGTVVAHRYREERPRDVGWRENRPWPVVAVRREPRALAEDVVLPAVEEIVGRHRRRIGDGRTGDDDELRRGNQVDPDAHV